MAVSIPLAIIICSTFVVMGLIVHVSQHIALRRKAKQLPSSEDITRRLERIEQIVEATAIEVERVAESNRFVTRLLGETRKQA